MIPTPTRAPARAARSGKKSAARALGALPEWNLADLYPGTHSAELKRDLDWMEAECVAFEKAYKGRLADIAGAASAGPTLAEAVRRYEKIDDVAGRLGAYAGLLHAGNAADPVLSKFYGDM
jgi:oligoendopeptidase F